MRLALVGTALLLGGCALGPDAPPRVADPPKTFAEAPTVSKKCRTIGIL